MLHSGLEDQPLCGAVDFSATPKEVDVGDTEPAQSSLNPSGFVKGASAICSATSGVTSSRQYPAWIAGGTGRCGTRAAVAAADVVLVASALLMRCSGTR